MMLEKIFKNKKGPFHMAEIVIATRQAVSLNGFSANTKQGDTKKGRYIK
jgi:hypothetical protein